MQTVNEFLKSNGIKDLNYDIFLITIQENNEVKEFYVSEDRILIAGERTKEQHIKIFLFNAFEWSQEKEGDLCSCAFECQKESLSFETIGTDKRVSFLDRSNRLLTIQNG